MKGFNDCVNLGIYSKWLGRLIKWALVKKGLKVVLYGRGKGSGQQNFGAKPIRYCKKVAVYVYHNNRQLQEMVA